MHDTDATTMTSRRVMSDMQRDAQHTTFVAALVVVGLIASVAVNVSSLAGVLLVFVLVVPFEKWFPRHVQPLRRPAVGTDLAYALSSGVLSTAGVVVGFVIAVASLAWLPGLILRPVVSMLPPLPMPPKFASSNQRG